MVPLREKSFFRNSGPMIGRHALTMPTQGSTVDQIPGFIFDPGTSQQYSGFLNAVSQVGSVATIWSRYRHLTMLAMQALATFSRVLCLAKTDDLQTPQHEQSEDTDLLRRLQV